MWVLLFLVIETEVKLKLVKEWKFDKPIKDVVINKINKEVYPKVVILGRESNNKILCNEILWYEGEHLKKRWSAEEIFGVHGISSHGKYLAVYTAKDKSEMINVKIFKEGEIIWEKEFRYPPMKVFFCESTGRFILPFHWIAKIHFYDEEGKILTIAKPLNDTSFIRGRKMQCYLTSDEKYFYVLISKKHTPCKCYHIIKYSTEGKEIWRYTFQENDNVYVYGPQISAKGNFIVFGVNKRKDFYTYLLSKEGELISSYRGVGKMKFTPDEKFLVILFVMGNKGLAVINTHTGNILWHKAFDITAPYGCNIKFSESGECFLVYKSGEGGKIISMSGKIIKEKIWNLSSQEIKYLHLSKNNELGIVCIDKRDKKRLLYLKERRENE